MEGSKVPRKSCDFCYLRKIKCDGRKPRCSHCIIYAVDCTYAAPSRQYKAKNRRGSAKIEKGTTTLQTRVQHLEALFEQFNKRSRGAEKQNGVQTRLQEAKPIPTVTLPMTTIKEGRNIDPINNSPKSLELPPLQQVLPLINIFLEKFNAVLPLFHAETLLRLVYESYNFGPQHRDTVAWAAINVVLALAHRQGLVGSSDTESSVDYLNRAQSVLSDVVLRDTQLLNIQVLVGMVMLLQGSQDLQPSLILIATTIRLAHKIGLHSRASSKHLDSVLARQRARVFWMAYILDKDLSVRSKQPSIQLDDDIDLDLPGPQIDEYRIDAKAEIDEASIETGIIATADGTVKMSYFVTRIQLAVIEGGVYDYLYSARSQKRSPEERSLALESVARALEQWRASIPPEFKGAEVLKRVPPDMLRFFCVLAATSLLCTTAINQAHAWNTQWVTSLRRYDKEGTVPLLPPQWEALVDEARDLMVLFGQLGVIDRWNFWITGCSYMTSMMLLTANSMHKAQHDKLPMDDQLVDDGFHVLEKMVEETKSEALRSFQDTCAELHQHAQQRRGQAINMAHNYDFSFHFPDTQWGAGNGEIWAS